MLYFITGFLFGVSLSVITFCIMFKGRKYPFERIYAKGKMWRVDDKTWAAKDTRTGLMGYGEKPSEAIATCEYLVKLHK